MGKKRLSASVDAELIGAAASAVARRRAESVSAWVNDALRLKRDHDRQLEALAAFIADYEAECGVITDDEMRQAERRMRQRAVIVRGRSAHTAARGRKRA
jgi:hypothetical protein